jgi:L-ascorbate metabolism protein UlaG (beta-lactamase superfamily)
MGYRMRASHPSLATSLFALLAVACGSNSPSSSQTPEPSSVGQDVVKNAEPVSDAQAGENDGESDTYQTSMGPLVVTPIWHGTVAFTIGGTTIVVDPWSKAPEGRLPKADLILLTDIHPDHLDKKAIEVVRKANTVIIGPAAVAAALPETSVLDNGQERVESGIGIRAIPMYNEKRGPEAGKLFHDKGRGNGYVLSFGDTNVYVSGDTECTAEMRALQDIDLALVCMNLPYTMPPEEAAECIKAFKPKVITPFHYRGSDLSILETSLEGTGIELRLRDYYAP